MDVRSIKILILTKGGTPVVEGQGVQREGPGQAGGDDGQAAPRYQEVIGNNTNLKKENRTSVQGSDSYRCVTHIQSISQ